MTPSVKPGGHLPFARIMVTGADGFVGHHLIAALRQTVSPDTAIWRAMRQPAGVGDVAFDLTDTRSIDAAVAQVAPDLIIHLAAQASVAGSYADAASTWDVNLVGSLTLAKAVAAHVPHATIVFASSAEVYGTTFNVETASEASALRPQSSYARAKAAAEAMLADVLPATSRLIVARLSNQSGPGQSADFVIPSFARQIARAEIDESAVVAVGNLAARRDFMDINDAVRAYLALLAASPQLPWRAVFNVGSGRDVEIGDILNQLLRQATRRIEVREDPARFRPSEVPVTRLDCSALCRLGWKPEIPLGDTIASVLADQRRQAGATGGA